VQALAGPAQHHAVAAGHGGDADRVDVGAHHEHAMPRGPRRDDGFPVRLFVAVLEIGPEDCLRGAAAERLQRLAAADHSREARKAQRSHDRAVGLDQVVLGQFVGMRPGERLGVERLRLAVIAGNLPDVEQHATVRVFVAQADERARLAHCDAELLGELALEPVERRLADRELAAGKFPAAGHVLAARTLRDQDAALAVRNRTRHHVDFRRISHPWPA
jgi:hypothetical protein